MHAKEWTVLGKSDVVGEMEENAKTNGTMLDVSMMVEIAAKIPLVAVAKMTWLSKKLMQLQDLSDSFD